MSSLPPDCFVSRGSISPYGSLLTYVFYGGVVSSSSNPQAGGPPLVDCQILEKQWEYNEAVNQLFIDFKKAYDTVRREVLYNIPIEFGVPKKLVRLVKMCLNETYSRVRVGKNVSDMFPIRNGLKQGDVLSSLLFNYTLEYAIRGFR